MPQCCSNLQLTLTEHVQEALTLLVQVQACCLTFPYICRWHKRSSNSITDTVRAATEAAALMRKQDPERFPSTPHSWYPLKADEDELGAPILCSSCFTRIDPEGSVSAPAAC